MSKYFFVTGIVLTLLLILNVVLFASAGIDLLFAIITVFAVLCLLSPVIVQWFRGILITGVGTLMFIGSIAFYVATIFFILTLLFSLPKTKPFESKFSLKPAPAQQESTFVKLIELTSDNYDSLDVDSTYYRQKVLILLAQNIPSAPLTKYKDQYIVPVDQLLPSITTLTEIYEKELEYISQLLEKKKVNQAQTQYLVLWNATKNHLSGRISLLQKTLSINQVNLLLDFLAQHEEKLKLWNNQELADILHEITNQLDDSIFKAYEFEYGVSQGIMLKLTGKEFITLVSEEDTPIRNTLLGLIGERWIKWPFLDYYKVLKIGDDMQAGIKEMSRKPVYEYHKSLKKFEDTYNKIHKQSPFTNPSMGWLGEIAVPAITNIMMKKEEIKSKLMAIEYVGFAKDIGDTAEIPIDPITGKKYTVTHENKTYTISGKDFEYIIKK